MTSLTPARDAVLANRPQVRAAMSRAFDAGGLTAMHAELTFGFNELIALHIADCKDRNVDVQDCFNVVVGALSNAIGTVVMSGTNEEGQEALWSDVIETLSEKSRRAIELTDPIDMTVSTLGGTQQVGNG